MLNRLLSLLALLLLAAAPAPGAAAQGAGLGQFSGQRDIGHVLHPGAAQYDAATGTYRVRGSGANTWSVSDELHYVWTKVDTDDVKLAADIRFVGMGGDPHRKAMLMIRQSLAPNAPYADVAWHGSGLASLQYRDAEGAVTREIRAPADAPSRVGIAKRGKFFYVFFAQAAGEPLQYSGAAMELPMHGPFYVGLGVCAHNKDAVETAVFSHVQMVASPEAAGPLVSTLETVEVASTDRAAAYTAPGRIAAPNWMRNGHDFLVNQNGRLERLEIPKGGLLNAAGVPQRLDAPALLDTGGQAGCNNDHGFSPDGSQIAFSDSSTPGSDSSSRIYLVSVVGGTPRLVATDGPSYWHGWSPDWKTLAYTGERHGNFDIYTVPATGGAAKRLTTSAGWDDGPEYSPDGLWIYFNSGRTGHMQIWRMRPDGSEPEQVTADETNDWFPHISPDGKWMVYLAYAPGVKGHPEEQSATIQLRAMEGGKTTLLAKLWGGQGTMDVPSWSPDSKQVAFVGYATPPTAW